MSTRVKIVPDETPNADGEWIMVDANTDNSGPPYLWRTCVAPLEPHVPKGFHIVAVGDRIANRFTGLDL